jgi:hypothetical protein
MAHEAVLDRPDVYRVLLEEYPEGTYVNVFQSSTAPGPYRDYLQPTLQIAKHMCLDDFGIQETDWRQVPNANWHG